MTATVSLFDTVEVAAVEEAATRLDGPGAVLVAALAHGVITGPTDRVVVGSDLVRAAVTHALPGGWADETPGRALAVGLGIARGSKRVWCLLDSGCCEEGSTFQAAREATERLVACVLAPDAEADALAALWDAAGWTVVRAAAASAWEVMGALDQALAWHPRPIALLLTYAPATYRRSVLERAASDVLRRLVAAGRTAVVTTPGGTTPFAVADGARIAGRRVVTVLGPSASDLRRVRTGRGQVLLTNRAAHLAAARDAGLVVVQPGWPADVEPLLMAALDVAEPVLVRVHRRPVVDVAPPEPAVLGGQRILCRGRSGLLVGAGAGAPLLLPVAEVLAARGLEVTAVDMPTIRPATGIDPEVTGRALLAGPVTVSDARGLTAIPFGDGTPGRIADLVAAALPPTR